MTLIHEVARGKPVDEALMATMKMTPEAVSYTHLTLPTNREV